MPKLTNPFETTDYDPAYADIVATALKRGRRGEGYSFEVDVHNVGEVAVLGELEREQIVGIVDGASGDDGPRIVAAGVTDVLIHTLTRQRLSS